MSYVIGAACVDVMDRSCVDECPVDCIYTGQRKLYIHPEECIDCGACAPVCPVDAVGWDRELADCAEQPAGTHPDAPHRADAVAFFYLPLPGREAPLREPGGAAGLGPVGVDTPLVAALPRQRRTATHDAGAGPGAPGP